MQDDNDGDDEDDNGGYGGDKSDNATTVTGTVAMGSVAVAVAKSDNDDDIIHAKTLRQMEGMVAACVEGEPWSKMVRLDPSMMVSTAPKWHRP